jgi:multiple sugar transport system substrate-binding protein
MRGRQGFVAVLFVTLLVGLSIFAGAGQGSGSKSEVASGTVVLSGWASSPQETALLRQVIRGFERTFPQIKVDYQPISGDYVAAMLAKFSARRPADVFYVDSNVILDWVTQGLIEPLDPYVTKSKFSTKPFYPTLLNGFKHEGKTYGFPKDWSPLAMEVNNAHAAQAGVRPTTITNWSTLTAAAKKLQPVVSGGRAICLSASWDRALAFVHQNGGSFLNQAKTQATVNTPAVRQAMNFYVGLIKQGLAGTPAQLGVDWCGEALGKGKAAIVFEGNWLFPYISTTFPDVKFTTVRMIQQKTHGNLAFTVSYSLARDSQNKEAAWQLIRYLVGKPGMKTWTSKGLALPSRSDVAPAAGRQPFLADAAFARPWQFAPQFSKVIDTANNELTGVIEGKTSVDAMLKKVHDTANDALKK